MSVYSLSGEQVGAVFQKVSEYNGVCNLSVEDISVMVYAIDNNCRLLTGDKKLKDKATLENVKVSGILFGSVNRTVSRLCFLFFASYLCADFISAYK